MPRSTRIAQESVTNARRHARHATLIRVRVAADEQAVRVEVTDDGAPQASAGSGYGLAGMAERAALLGGSCDAGPAQGRGGWSAPGGGRGWRRANRYRPGPPAAAGRVLVRHPDARAGRDRGDTGAGRPRGGRPLAVVVITTFDLDEYVYGELRAGAKGFLLKDALGLRDRAGGLTD
jgi:hypothetical protein